MLAQQSCADKEILEIEEYLGFLRAKRSVIETRVAEADEQIGVMQEVLDQHQFSESSNSSDDELELPASSSSLGSDDCIEAPTSDDHAAWNTCDLTAVTDSPSIRSQRQKLMDGLTEDIWHGEVSDVSDESEVDESDEPDKE